MAKIAYVGLPAHGHTNPTLPVMKELVDRGHHVLYYNAESFRDKLAPTGVDFRPLPEPMPTEKELSDALHELIDASIILSRMSAPLARYLIDEFSREQPDLVIYDSAAMWGYIAARTHHIPNICFITTFVLEGSLGTLGSAAVMRFVLSALRHAPGLLKWRRGMATEFGAENSGGITEFGDLNFVFTSREFHPPNTRIDDSFRFVGPSIDPDIRQETFPYDQLVDGSKVYISLGTINHLDLDFYRSAFAAFGHYPAQFILSVGKNTAVADLGNIPANFIVRNQVPQLEILQEVDAFITHGGMNSVHEGLYYGVPEIVVPHQVEQLLNGKRVAQTGTGILLGETRPYGRVTAGELRNALDTLLDDSRYRDNAAEMGQTLRDAGGYRQAVDEIENFVANPEAMLTPAIQ